MKLVALAVLSTAVAVAAPAAAVADTIVIEAFDGARPSDADQWLGPVLGALTLRGAVAGPDLVERFERSVAREHRSLTPATRTEVIADIDRSYEALVDGAYDTAAAAARTAVDRLGAASHQLAREPALRDAQFKALLVLARASEALGNQEEALRAAAEAHRTFPGREVSTRHFDPRVRDLHRRAAAQLATVGTGSLEIRADDAATQIYVNERLIGAGAARLDELAPGLYRVFVVRGIETGRVHDVTVVGASATAVTLPWDRERSIQATDGRLAMRCADGVLRASELSLAREVAEQVGATDVVVLGVRSVDARRSVVGYAARLGSSRYVYASIALEPFAPDQHALQRLGGLLAGDAVDTSGIALREPTAPPAPRPPDLAAAQRRSKIALAGWTIVAGGAAITATGGAMLWTADDRREQAGRAPTPSRRADLREQADDMHDAGVVVTVAGVGVAALGAVILFRLHRDDDDDRGPAITGVDVGGDGVRLRGIF